MSLIKNITNNNKVQNYNNLNYYKQNEFINNFLEEKMFINFFLSFTLIYLFVIIKVITSETLYSNFNFLLLLGFLTFILMIICLVTIL